MLLWLLTACAFEKVVQMTTETLTLVKKDSTQRMVQGVWIDYINLTWRDANGVMYSERVKAVYACNLRIGETITARIIR